MRRYLALASAAHDDAAERRGRADNGFGAVGGNEGDLQRVFAWGQGCWQPQATAVHNRLPFPPRRNGKEATLQLIHSVVEHRSGDVDQLQPRDKLHVGGG